MNFYGKELNVYKANLHTHSTTSDGLFTPQQIVRIYEEGGYDCLCLTDHKNTNAVSELKSENMTLLSGIELHPVGPRNIPWHLLCLNVPYGFPGEFACGQEAVDAVNAAGGIVFVAHPYWCGFTSAEVMSLQNTAGMEVYNTSTRYIGKEFNMTIWDEVLDHGRMCNALAVDDVHQLHDLFRGWTMICAEDKKPESLVAALRNGEYYASMGPEIYSLEYKDGVFRAKFSAVESAILMSNKCYGNCGTVPDPHYLGEGLRPVSELVCNAKEWFPAGSYARLQLRSADGRYAWSNPFMV